MLKQMIEYNKSTFENAYKTMSMLQDQMLNAFGNQPSKEWINTLKNGQDNFKKTIDKNFNLIEGD